MSPSGPRLGTTAVKLKTESQHGGHRKDAKLYPHPEASHEQVTRDRALFYRTLESLLSQLSIRLKVPKVGGQEVDLHRLYIEVTNNGGLHNVITHKRWVMVCEPFKFPSSFTNKSFVIRKLYVNILHHYEQVYYHGTREFVPPPSGPGVCEGKRKAMPAFPCMLGLLGSNGAAGSPTHNPTTTPPPVTASPTGSSNTAATGPKAQAAPTSVQLAISGLPQGTHITGMIDCVLDNAYSITLFLPGQQLSGLLYKRVPEGMSLVPGALPHQVMPRNSATAIAPMHPHVRHMGQAHPCTPQGVMTQPVSAPLSPLAAPSNTPLSYGTQPRPMGMHQAGVHLTPTKHVPHHVTTPPPNQQTRGPSPDVLVEGMRRGTSLSHKLCLGEGMVGFEDADAICGIECESDLDAYKKQRLRSNGGAQVTAMPASLANQSPPLGMPPAAAAAVPAAPAVGAHGIPGLLPGGDMGAWQNKGGVPAPEPPRSALSFYIGAQEAVAQAGSGGGSDPTSGRDRGSGASGSGSAAPKVDHQAAWVALAPEQRAVYEDMEARDQQRYRTQLSDYQARVPATTYPPPPQAAVGAGGGPPIGGPGALTPPRGRAHSINSATTATHDIAPGPDAPAAPCNGPHREYCGGGGRARQFGGSQGGSSPMHGPRQGHPQHPLNPPPHHLRHHPVQGLAHAAYPQAAPPGSMYTIPPMPVDIDYLEVDYLPPSPRLGMYPPRHVGGYPLPYDGGNPMHMHMGGQDIQGGGWGMGVGSPPPPMQLRHHSAGPFGPPQGYPSAWGSPRNNTMHPMHTMHPMYPMGPHPPAMRALPHHALPPHAVHDDVAMMGLPMMAIPTDEQDQDAAAEGGSPKSLAMQAKSIPNELGSPRDAASPRGAAQTPRQGVAGGGRGPMTGAEAAAAFARAGSNRRGTMEADMGGLDDSFPPSCGLQRQMTFGVQVGNTGLTPDYSDEDLAAVVQELSADVPEAAGTSRAGSPP